MKSAVYPLTLVNGVLRPIVPIIFFNPTKDISLKAEALVDTGADVCFFPKHVAVATGHNLKGVGVEESSKLGVGGVDVKTWRHTFVIKLLSPCKEKILMETKGMLIDCAEHDRVRSLLGYKDFLENFKVNVDYLKKELTLQWH